jgi:glycosyltransferase involved in cell wall biosynthesis
VVRRPRVIFLTVIPSPYQRQLFEALESDGRLKIRVLYYARTAADRNWSTGPLAAYEEILPGKTLNWLGPSAHYNMDIATRLNKYSAELFVVSDYSAPTTQIAMRVLHRLRKKWVFWGETPGFSHTHLRGLFRHQLQRPIARGATAIAAIGSEAAAAYQKLFPHIRVFNIPYFCDLEPFRAAATATKKRNEHRVDVLFSGQLIERKGVDLLIRAFALVADQVPELHLRLIGTGPALTVLMDMVPVRLQERIHFLGFQQSAAIPKIFAAADMFVLPSRHDGWGVVVNEALGSGLPIIVSNRVGARDLVENDCNGFVIAAGDVEALANALLRLGRSSDLRKSFGHSSAERAANWGLDEGVRRWVELSDQLLKA